MTEVSAAMEQNDISGALRTVLNILDAWHIPQAHRLALLGCDPETYNRWLETRQLGEVLPDTVERLSYILGIYSALQVLFPEPGMADTWIHRPNGAPEFGGQTPMAIMAQRNIDGLARVRRFLDSWLA